MKKSRFSIPWGLIAFLSLILTAVGFITYNADLIFISGGVFFVSVLVVLLQFDNLIYNAPNHDLFDDYGYC